MLSYKDELKKYEPAILIEDMEDSIYSADFRDIFELMQYIVCLLYTSSYVIFVVFRKLILDFQSQTGVFKYRKPFE